MHEVTSTHIDGRKFEDKLMPRRFGTSIFSEKNKKVYFNYLEEAIIEDLTIRLEQECFKNIPELGEEFKEREGFIQKQKPKKREEYQQDLLSIHTEYVEDIKQYKCTMLLYPYRKERARLKKIIDEIYEKDQASGVPKFAQPEDVFRLFAQATLTGKLLPVMREIRGTYGIDYVRELAEETAKPIEN